MKARDKSQHLILEKIKLRLWKGRILQGHRMRWQSLGQDSSLLLPSGLSTK